MSTAARVTVPLRADLFRWLMVWGFAHAVTPDRSRAEAVRIAREVGLARRDDTPPRPARIAACGKLIYLAGAGDGTAVLVRGPGVPPCRACLELIASGSTVLTPHAGPVVAAVVSDALAAMRRTS